MVLTKITTETGKELTFQDIRNAALYLGVKEQKLYDIKRGKKSKYATKVNYTVEFKEVEK